MKYLIILLLSIPSTLFSAEMVPSNFYDSWHTICLTAINEIDKEIAQSKQECDDLSEVPKKKLLSLISKCALEMGPLIQTNTFFITLVIPLLSTKTRVSETLLALYFSQTRDSKRICLDYITNKIEESTSLDLGINKILEVSPLSLSITFNIPPVVKSLFEAGAPIDGALAHKTTLLMLAAETNNPHLIEEIKIRLTQKHWQEMLNAQDAEGRTALYRALKAQCSITARQLLSYGADPNKTSLNGMTPLHLSAIQNDFKNIALLLHFNADTNIPDNSERTALMVLLLSIKKSRLNREILDLLQELFTKTSLFVITPNKFNESATFWAQARKIQIAALGST